MGACCAFERTKRVKVTMPADQRDSDEPDSAEPWVGCSIRRRPGHRSLVAEGRCRSQSILREGVRVVALGD